MRIRDADDANPTHLSLFADQSGGNRPEIHAQDVVRIVADEALN
jgi:hypothetical protein